MTQSKPSVLGLIPARGGSKRIPQKNIRPFLGKPILDYAIKAAQACALFDDVVVSTDCEKIAAIARDCDASTPFMRPPALADDFTGTQAVVEHAIKALAAHGQHFDYVCCIYATNPLLQSAALVEGFNRLRQEQCDYVVSAVAFDFPIQRALVCDGNKIMPAQAESMLARSQDLTPMYHDAAQFYWGTSQAFSHGKLLWGDKTRAVILPSTQVQDIDTLDDWVIAEIKYQRLQEQLGG
ncbi:pseudaminic acid cytidylyltransferase [Marinagarivorans cellulosilyticus]|uniref:Pseudaminic acid cytidylyltransferase n=1 Tax=Marinagarivorans cellulosilyticus TaxID=2721545 RepID=A0AAN2BLM3_9GAMM|nr:pseudaminic acid cytidylyltransferase [Marinagarivorans cellulosilyticus]BCD99288.1 pseudaminic acid cytidylyltransferase [Marinagarivorans cellulosilyticus]